LLLNALPSAQDFKMLSPLPEFSREEIKPVVVSAALRGSVMSSANYKDDKNPVFDPLMSGTCDITEQGSGCHKYKRFGTKDESPRQLVDRGELTTNSTKDTGITGDSELMQANCNIKMSSESSLALAEAMVEVRCCLTSVAKTSSTILNRYGESGQPYLVPVLSFSPFNLMLAIGLLYIDFITFKSCMIGRNSLLPESSIGPGRASLWVKIPLVNFSPVSGELPGPQSPPVEVMPKEEIFLRSRKVHDCVAEKGNGGSDTTEGRWHRGH
ncbi:hypothetical protein STEG23_011822, partial [Scotinomys teguina]